MFQNVRNYLPDNDPSFSISTFIEIYESELCVCVYVYKDPCVVLSPFPYEKQQNKTKKT